MCARAAAALDNFEDGRILARKLLQLAAALVLEQAEGYAHELRRAVAELEADLFLVEVIAQGEESSLSCWSLPEKVLLPVLD